MAFARTPSSLDLLRMKIIREHLQTQHNQDYPIKKLKKHLPSFLSYLDIKDEKTAREQVALEKRQIEGITQSASLLSTSATVALSFIGVKTNQEHAKNALRILLKAFDECNDHTKDEAVVTITALRDLAVIYKQLPKRASYSLTNLWANPPKLLTAIDSVFKEFDIDPEDKKLEAKALSVFKCFN